MKKLYFMILLLSSCDSVGEFCTRCSNACSPGLVDKCGKETNKENILKEYCECSQILKPSFFGNK